MKFKLILTLALSVLLIIACTNEELIEVEITVSETKCVNNSRFLYTNCELITDDDRTYIFGDELLNLKKGNKVKLKVEGFNQIKGIEYSE